MAYSPRVMTLIFIKPRREKVREPISLVAAKTDTARSISVVTCSVLGRTAALTRPRIQRLRASRHIACAMLASPKLA